MTELGSHFRSYRGRVTELEKDKAGLTNERDKLKEERDALKLGERQRWPVRSSRSTIGLRKQNSGEPS